MYFEGAINFVLGFYQIFTETTVTEITYIDQ